MAIALVGLLLPQGAYGTQSGICEADGAARIDSAFSRWITLFGNRLDGSAVEAESEAILRDIFAVEAMASRILGHRWDRLRDHERQRFTSAIVRATRSSVLPYFQSQGSIPALRRANEEWRRRGGIVEARYWLVGSDSSEWFTLRLVQDDDGSCGILDVRKDDRSLLDELGGRVGRALDDYSFPYMVAELGGYDVVVFEDFEDDEVGVPPIGWTWREGDRDKNKPYRVRREDGNQYLEATDRGESVILGIDRPWNLNEFPYVSFRVRVNRIPAGGDERDDKKVDSAAGVYFTLNKTFFGRIPESVKYVWSSTQPIGTAVQRDGIGRPWQVVFGTGEDRLGEWRTYTFDARQAYIDTFGGTPPNKGIGVGVLSDANSTGSQAYADYDDIRALRRAPPGVTSGVLKVVPPIKNRD